ncbi:MAG: hypothetical protein COU28_02810 [Candidatus Magasanikbacteria bacterium CG10_big_fil_rev_8_21_14_0_10_36_16]|uniref:Uncharacterized protein n=1 Tax=Candidatus Magasanikbacteria bacterium CG10_big_fil_rev_8_21_14_0_10_36_16 TaxID=1974645 RepID=A0A2H0TYB0_9BACT|nr:MAG: hypothetical protein COU28_02810 [Candidatus Magasanikbacteria bacterium CG10_big_fil_rev_8_21_14_0_10_36_16]
MSIEVHRNLGVIEGGREEFKKNINVNLEKIREIVSSIYKDEIIKTIQQKSNLNVFDISNQKLHIVNIEKLIKLSRYAQVDSNICLKNISDSFPVDEGALENEPQIDTSVGVAMITPNISEKENIVYHASGIAESMEIIHVALNKLKSLINKSGICTDRVEYSEALSDIILNYDFINSHMDWLCDALNKRLS